jgi:5-methylcytosine-specific restriction endonuclease McrA
MQSVLVLNTTYQPLNITNMRRALKMLYLNKAEIIKNNGYVIRTTTMTMAVPSIIRLMNFVTIPERQVPLSRKYILLRDRYTCQYCGKQEMRHMTIDHVIPRSRGGKSTWENLVCACRHCNNRKNNRPPAEAQMALLKPPSRPGFRHMLFINLQNTPTEWLPYLDKCGYMSF